jgi:hypothetical protein
MRTNRKQVSKGCWYRIPIALIHSSLPCRGSESLCSVSKAICCCFCSISYAGSTPPAQNLSTSYSTLRIHAEPAGLQRACPEKVYSNINVLGAADVNAACVRTHRTHHLRQTLKVQAAVIQRNSNSLALQCNHPQPLYKVCCTTMSTRTSCVVTYACLSDSTCLIYMQC